MIAKEIRDKLAAETESERLKVERQVSSRLADAERRIADMKTRAMSEVGQIATETAGSIVGQLTGKTVGQAELAAAIKTTLGK